MLFQVQSQPTDTLLVLSDSLYSETSFQLSIGNHPEWRFYPGDDPSWANPDYDHSHWYHIRPSGLTNPLPDSLWPGYGWFRMKFKADSTFYNRAWNLYFFTWGAAEVYLDGRLIKSFGTYSTDPKKEIRYSPNSKIDPPVALAPRDTHLVAVRLSYHTAARYKKIMGDLSGNFGFGFGFSGEDRNQQIQHYYRLSMRVSYISAAVLLIITLMHGYLFYLFRTEKANLYIALITFLLFLHSIFAFPHVHFEFDRLWTYISGDISFLTLFLGAVYIIPYTVVQIFNLENQEKFKHLIWMVIPLLITGVINISLSLIIFLFSAAIVLSSTIYLLIKAYKNRQRGVGFVALGFIGLMVLVFIVVGYGELADARDWEVEWFLIILIYLIVPVSMTLLMSYKMAYLYTGLESIVTERTAALEKSLIDLKSAQDQLIQQEKLASLGQLTAGIAHEIKNPLNFVNNFSSVSVELIQELRDDIESLRPEIQTKIDALAAESNSKFKIQNSKSNLEDIEVNLQKIHEHGTRADSIVKSMLLHSRGGTGKMEPTDLNALVKEYVNLAYHGMRAGKNPISVDIKLNLDEKIGEIPMMAEDFSRVILNLCNNAFDAMRPVGTNAGSAVTNAGSAGTNAGSAGSVGASHGLPSRLTPPQHPPKLTIRTKSGKGHITIEIEDNGPGIPDNIKDKIMQPFFTTKKGTEGTGLGLSITNDIIKAHRGDLKIESQPGKSTFIISIPDSAH